MGKRGEGCEEKRMGEGRRVCIGMEGKSGRDEG